MFVSCGTAVQLERHEKTRNISVGQQYNLIECHEKKHNISCGTAVCVHLEYPEISCGTNVLMYYIIAHSFLPIHSGHQVRWTYQPGSHRRKVTQDF